MVTIKNKIPALYVNPILIAGSVLLYLLLFKLLFTFFKESMFMFSFIPIAFAGLISGKRAGIFTAFLILLLNYFLLPHTYTYVADAAIQSIPAVLTALGIGGMTGWLRQLLKKTDKYAENLEKEQISLNTQMRERALIETKLRKSQERYRSIVDNINEVIFHIDNDNKWTFLNPAWSKLTGFSVKES
ncbi:MAG: PAS domain-containing protein, partial [Ignavibacteriaceae bacterium]